MAKKTSEQVIALATEKISSALGKNLSALVLYGSHARGEAHVRSDINLFILVHDSAPEQLAGLLQVLPTLAKRKNRVAPPVFMTEEGFAASQDTYALEFLDMAASRRLLAGRDPFENFKPHWDGLRTEIERELRTKMMQLYRQWYLSREKVPALKALLRGSLSSFLSLLRGIVALEKRQVMAIPQARLLDEITGERGLDPTLWRRFRQVTGEKVRISARDMRALFRSYLAEVRKLTAYIDKFSV